MDYPSSNTNGRSYYQMDPQVTGDQLSSHPSHDLHNAAYPESDHQPGMGYTPPPPGASSSQSNALGQDSKPYPPSGHIHEVAYQTSNFGPGGGYSPAVGISTVPASDVIDNAAYPESNYRPSTAYSTTPPPGSSQSHPLPCPKRLDSAPSVQSQWTRGAPSSSAGRPSGVVLPQPTGSELPPPPYQPGTGDSSAAPRHRPPQTQPASPSYSGNDDSYAGHEIFNSPPSASSRAQQQQETIPMTTFPVYQNAIGHVANRSNASSALERGYKEYDPDQARLDDRNRRRNRRKWLIGTLATTVIVAAIIGVVVALVKFKVFDDDDDD
ncbi:hypothetical protein ISF_06005 [Cordyceps fumosorosea ARSEF 2679]|uniref:Uncharacterized protein n=1 Tax=Cordyceps fumosorosea (strain ARSEF 2679) TaxID=1081104 RepID=A0A167SWB0_CORFA|nr:hypothetical protein ISF_06005 [Cordyceps fumosorosea ARSEF 2679]OAA59994.1 hypothetical protein ISF_06005 [Cordyceps fumosorosea ARSEF 2679]